MPEPPARVGLFVTCLVDLFRPSVGFAAVKLLEAAGCTVEVPRAQTCCGQPAYNSGDRADAVAIARQVIAAFADFDYVVAPSGSCAAMIREHYPVLFAGEGEMAARAEAVAAKTHELVSFLSDVRGMRAVDAAFAGSVTYHDACSGLRELGIQAQPRALLASVAGSSSPSWPMPRSAAASAAPSASSTRRSRTPSSPPRPSASRQAARTRCSPATWAA